ncbi:hypothetical protein ALC57_10238 [Trachymyrmex cornetzi]|uniref:Uncharacterized protein n=1 Tax=Trachymyrmex cornetzi TaxID=471704 RepID=A0A195DX84_9HYME|nr:hypothetical protein ALC57_10238 [Trachymyrmex cornetzi]
MRKAYELRKIRREERCTRYFVTPNERRVSRLRREREREREKQKEGGPSDFYGNSVSRAFLCCKSSWKPGSNNGSGPPRDIQPLGAFACISIRYPFPGGREESPQSSRRVEAGRRLLCTSVHAPGAIVRVNRGWSPSSFGTRKGGIQGNAAARYP